MPGLAVREAISNIARPTQAVGVLTKKVSLQINLSQWLQQNTTNAELSFAMTVMK